MQKVLSIFLMFFSIYASGQSPEDSHFDYVKFKKEMFYYLEIEKEIHKNQVTNFLFNPDVDDDHRFVTQIIENYRRLKIDIYFIHAQYSYNGTDMESYGTETHTSTEIYVFQNGQILNKNKKSPFINYNGNELADFLNYIQINYRADIAVDYYMDYDVNPDTTFLIDIHSTIYQNITGFDESITKRIKLLCEFNNTGSLDVKDVAKIELSSFFFDINNIKNMGNIKYYPTKEHPFDFFQDSYLNLNPFYIGKSLLFYIRQEKSGKFFPVFELIDIKNNLCNKYIVGTNNLCAMDVSSIHLNFPILIETSDGNILLDTDGVFNKNHKNIKQ
jgi:hypothetical protein